MTRKRPYFFLLTLLFLLYSFNTYAQARMYLHAGTAGVGAINNFGYGDLETRYFSADLEYEKKFTGSISFLTGISVFNAGYTTDFSDLTLSNYSNFRAMYMAVPLMVRWNIGNINSYLIDIGLEPYYLLDAYLKESVMKFGKPVTVQGRITEFSRHFYLAYRFQVSVLIDRFSIGVYFLLPGKGQSSLKGLEDHWGLNVQQSVYLETNGFAKFYMVGLRIGARIL